MSNIWQQGHGGCVDEHREMIHAIDTLPLYYQRVSLYTAVLCALNSVCLTWQFFSLVYNNAYWYSVHMY
jgi:hypothetical protein